MLEVEMFTGLMLFLIPNQPSVRRLKQDVLPRYSGIRQIELLMFFLHCEPYKCLYYYYY